MKPINEEDEIRVLGGSNWRPTVDSEMTVSSAPQRKRRFSLKKWIGGIVVFLLCLGCAFYLYREYYVYRFSYPLSRTQQEVIESMQRTLSQDTIGIDAVCDSVLGVSMNLYKINGLKAELTQGVPNLEDERLYLVTRSADYRYQQEEQIIIGDYILSGEELQHNSWRAGYFSVVDGHAEMGIGRRPEMRDYVMDHHGSMFRQFALVSAGVKCVSQYRLKGKVTRCAYARMPNNDLYFVETRYPETLYGFSDALIEYGFVDAIYVTGGSQKNLFYRDCKGQRHGDYVDDSKHHMVVWKK